MKKSRRNEVGREVGSIIIIEANAASNQKTSVAIPRKLSLTSKSMDATEIMSGSINSTSMKQSMQLARIMQLEKILMEEREDAEEEIRELNDQLDECEDSYDKKISELEEALALSTQEAIVAQERFDQKILLVHKKDY